MMEQLSTKFCYACERELPATEEFFFPSYLERGGKNVCKECHRERAKNSPSISYRVKLRERATPISSEQVPLYKSLNSIAATIGLSIAVVEHDIFNRNLPVYTFIYNKVGPALALRMEDAKIYIREHAQNGYTPEILSEESSLPPDLSVGQTSNEFLASKDGNSLVIPKNASFTPINGQDRSEDSSGQVSASVVTPKKPEMMGSPDICGCCKNGKGNILAVHDTDQQVVAYLCSTCYRAARSFDWEPERLRAVAQLIETIGGNIDRSRR